MWTKRLMWIADVGFILYWTTTAFHLLPAEWLYAAHDNPLMVAWNWSFFPLDMLASITGLWALLRPYQSDTLKTMSLPALVVWEEICAHVKLHALATTMPCQKSVWLAATQI